MLGHRWVEPHALQSQQYQKMVGKKKTDVLLNLYVQLLFGLCIQSIASWALKLDSGSSTMFTSLFIIVIIFPSLDSSFPFFCWPPPHHPKKNPAGSLSVFFIRRMFLKPTMYQFFSWPSSPSSNVMMMSFDLSIRHWPKVSRLANFLDWKREPKMTTNHQHWRFVAAFQKDIGRSLIDECVFLAILSGSWFSVFIKRSLVVNFWSGSRFVVISFLSHFRRFHLEMSAGVFHIHRFVPSSVKTDVKVSAYQK